MRRFALTLALGVIALPLAARAQTWAPIARQCVAQIGEQGGHWPEWSECTIKRAFPQINPERVQVCIAQVAVIREREQACNNCGDPVADVVRCARRGGQ